MSRASVRLVRGGKGSFGDFNEVFAWRTPRQAGHVYLSQPLVDPVVSKRSSTATRSEESHFDLLVVFIILRWLAACFEICVIERPFSEYLVMAVVHRAN